MLGRDVRLDRIGGGETGRGGRARAPADWQTRRGVDGASTDAEKVNAGLAYGARTDGKRVK